MRTYRSTRGVVLSIAAFVGSALAVHAAASDEIQALRDQIQQLDQKLRVLERKQELKDEAAESAAKSAPKISITDKGFALASADGTNVIKLRGLAQLDSRLFFDNAGAGTNAFVLRRARIIAEGTFARAFSFQLVPEFGGSSVSILDANLGVAVNRELSLKFGKFKPSVGLELLQSDSWTFFNERSIVTNLVPNRDLGVEASGSVLDGTVSYAAGIFGGVPDGGSTSNSDFDNEKDFVARVIATPFKRDSASPLAGLSFGVAASLGREKTASGVTGGYKTDGQQTFFKYASSTISDGQSWRVSPQLEYRNGPFGLISEYVVSTVNVRPSATGAKAELQNHAWQVAAGYVLTGENSSYSGVVPKANFDPVNGTWGAFEVTARYADLKVDDAAFPLYASAASAADEAASIGVGLNWYLAKAVAFKFDYYQTKFDFAPGAPAVPTTAFLRQDEKVFISRFQVSF